MTDRRRAAAIGLVRAMDGTPELRALRAAAQVLRTPGADAVLLREEKFRLSPDCRTCASPCLRHADYDDTQAQADTPELRAAKEDAWTALLAWLAAHEPDESTAQPMADLLYYLGESWVGATELKRCLKRLGAI